MATFAPSDNGLGAGAAFWGGSRGCVVVEGEVGRVELSKLLAVLVVVGVIGLVG